jgi:ketosteroid isomerase-like protein
MAAMEAGGGSGGPGQLVDRLRRVTNDHDLAGIGACFAADYRLEMPVHPGRAFVGREQVVRNWGQILAGVPDITVEATWVAEGDLAWSEWEMRGTRRDGTPHLMRGVIIFRVRDGQFSSARFYVEPVEAVEPGAARIDEVVRQTVAGANAGVGAGSEASARAAVDVGAVADPSRAATGAGS